MECKERAIAGTPSGSIVSERVPRSAAKRAERLAELEINGPPVTLAGFLHQANARASNPEQSIAAPANATARNPNEANSSRIKVLRGAVRKAGVTAQPFSEVRGAAVMGGV
jgi:hypothetical protein